MARIGFITGIKKEAEILLGYPNAKIVCAGAKTDNAYAQANSLIKNGCEILISFGVAGALDPSLNAGDIVLPRSVIHKDGTVFKTASDLHQKSSSHMSEKFSPSNGPIFGSTTLISNSAEKQRLFQSHGTIAVDMESLGVAKAAQENDCPFLAIRAISDTAQQNLPAASLQAIDQDGNIKIARVLKELAKKPSDLPALLKLGGNSSKAFASLRRVAALGLGF